MGKKDHHNIHKKHPHQPGRKPKRDLSSTSSTNNTPQKRVRYHSSKGSTTSVFHSPNAFDLLDSYDLENVIEPRVSVVQQKNIDYDANNSTIQQLMKQTETIINTVNKQNGVLGQIQSNLNSLCSKFDCLNTSVSYPVEKCVTIAPFSI